MAKKAYVWDGTSWISISSTIPEISSILPSQTGNSGKFLTTNGSSVSWGTVDLTPYATTAALSSHESDTTNIHGITNTANLATNSSVSATIDNEEILIIAGAL